MEQFLFKTTIEIQLSSGLILDLHNSYRVIMLRLGKTVEIEFAKSELFKNDEQPQRANLRFQQVSDLTAEFEYDFNPNEAHMHEFGYITGDGTDEYSPSEFMPPEICSDPFFVIDLAAHGRIRFKFKEKYLTYDTKV